MSSNAMDCTFSVGNRLGTTRGVIESSAPSESLVELFEAAWLDEGEEGLIEGARECREEAGDRTAE